MRLIRGGTGNDLSYLIRAKILALTPSECGNRVGNPRTDGTRLIYSFEDSSFGSVYRRVQRIRSTRLCSRVSLFKYSRVSLFKCSRVSLCSRDYTSDGGKPVSLRRENNMGQFPATCRLPDIGAK
jgi:hypothetical protein